MSTVTNQKLFYAQLMFDAFTDHLRKAETPRERLCAKGYAEACVLQLMLAYRCFLDEIVNAYRLRDLNVPGGLGAHLLQAYTEACVARDVASPELNYFCELSKDKSTWLSALLDLFEHAYQSSEPEQDTFSEQSQNIIFVQQIDKIDPLKTQATQLVWILDGMRSAIEYCRHTMQEY